MAIRRTDLAEIPPRRAGRGRGSRQPHQVYDWDSWTDGAVWELIPGEDFTVPLAQMRSQVKTHARRSHMYAVTRETDTNTLLVQFTPGECAYTWPNGVPCVRKAERGSRYCSSHRQ